MTPPEAGAGWLLMDDEGYIELRPTHFFGWRTVHVSMCDFASAGNGWSEDSLYRTWVPQPLLLSAPFVKDTWKLLYPDEAVRPNLGI